MTPECPKGPESEVRPQENAPTKELVDYLRRLLGYRFDELLAAANFLDEDDQASTLAVFEDVLPLVGKEIANRDAAYNLMLADTRAARDAELERLTAEVERQKRKALVDRYLLRGMARRASLLRRRADRWQSRAEQEFRNRVTDTAKAMAESGQQRAEVSRLREQLAAQPHVPVDASDHVFAALERVAGVHTGGQLGDQTDAVMDLLKSWGVSSSEVEAPQPKPIVHHVMYDQLNGEWQATCSGCPAQATGSLPHVEFWRDQHEADTLRPVGLTNESFISSQDEDERVPTLEALQAERRRYTRVEGRPSGSGAAAPQAVETGAVYPADLFKRKHGEYVCVCGDIVPSRQAHLSAGYTWGCIDRESPAQPKRSAAQAARSEATPRVWMSGDPEPIEPGLTIQSYDGVTWFRRQSGQWTGSAGWAFESWGLLTDAEGTLTEVMDEIPSPSLRKEGEDSDPDA